ncbi:GNAT family N-acetyltransferase [Flavivirga jejuensis]|uniref:GNAT family N-acetyltransferase n=1 Tax=Flavivirga jejuensis TaxID=870487 RepID=A0ABT8WNQ7_9FLAO|nr:GNAT family N-acetyltransferase [Flavivirga jejuensis]MDO5974619.1 GNAT family N-acetyltransferase [Flavivirga jejuensis]
MAIRIAEKKDFEAIKKLVKAHAKFEKAGTLSNNSLNRLSNYIFNIDVVECLVVELNDEIVGYATFMKQFSTWNANYYIYLDCLFLNEQTRGKGIGTQIMDSIKIYAKSINCSEIQWQTPDFNKKAIDFYNKIGGKSKSKERFCLNIW